jgi:hypothetical protein
MNTIRTTVLRTSPVRTSYTRPFSISARYAADKRYPEKLSTDDSVDTSMYPDDDHAVLDKNAKGDDLDVQSESAAKGMQWVFLAVDTAYTLFSSMY